MYSAFDRWAHWSHMLTVISMFSPCTQWVFGPLSPVCLGRDRCPRKKRIFCCCYERSKFPAVRYVVTSLSMSSVACFQPALLIHCVNAGSAHLYCALVHSVDLWFSFCRPTLYAPFCNSPRECLEILSSPMQVALKTHVPN